ncbi:N-glycosylase/DNA lyase [Thermococcus sp. Bubb.Bath]|uniref:N-glycosylase/DNA lyase n=1 Tax=Thermococcus sp. Bubb.Bath TaxID=1638242 RepID=UPI00143A2B3E|nr:N-glycosylase/DNA lyase [Thermococcus sp. Bubb.Bath]NJF24686.1 N-glycosylase/DNA lyase [Thermococcus sp. Bubb.Bath]
MTLEKYVKIHYRADKDKVERIREILRELGVECARIIEEKVDLQFDALRNLRENLGNDELFLNLVVANSIVSYQLSGKGENWWWEFSRYFSSHPPKGGIVDAYLEFLPASRTNRRLVARKLSRLKKLEPFLDSLDIDDLRNYYFAGMVKLREELAETLGSRKSAKTVVFAIKMFGYAGRIAFEEFVPYPMELEIPEDVRIKVYTGRITNEPPVSFWGRVSKETGVPPLHIDSILWPALGGNERVVERLQRHCGERAKLVLELTEL